MIWLKAFLIVVAICGAGVCWLLWLAAETVRTGEDRS